MGINIEKLENDRLDKIIEHTGVKPGTKGRIKSILSHPKHSESVITLCILDAGVKHKVGQQEFEKRLKNHSFLDSLVTIDAGDNIGQRVDTTDIRIANLCYLNTQQN